MAKKFVKSLKTEQEYVLSGQDPEDKKPSKVKFLPLNKQEVAQVEDRKSGFLLKDTNDREMTVNYMSNAYGLVLNKLTDWENIHDDNDKPIAFEKDTTGSIKKELLDEVFDMDTIAEIGNVIFQVSAFPESAEAFLGK